MAVLFSRGLLFMKTQVAMVVVYDIILIVLMAIFCDILIEQFYLLPFQI